MRSIRSSASAGGFVLVLSSAAAAQDRLWTAFGDARDDWLGWTVTVMGDLDGDGTLDVAAAMPYATGPGTLRLLDGRSGATLFDIDPGGAGVLSSVRLGDVDLDGVEDLLVRTRATTASIHAWSGGSRQPLYVVDSDLLPIVVGDVDRDGRPDFATARLPAPPAAREARILSGLDGSLLLTLAPAGRTDRFLSGWAPSGDVDGDGTPDLAISDPDGGAAGLGTVQMLSGRDGSVLASIDGDVADANFGAQLFSMGDMDGDGVVDLAIGAPAEDAGSIPRAGVIRFVSGASRTEIARLSGSGKDERFRITAVVGDVDGDGMRDFVAAPTLGYPDDPFEPDWIHSGRTLRRLYAEQSEFLLDSVAIAGGADFDGDGIEDIVSGRTGWTFRGCVSVDRGATVFLSPCPRFKPRLPGGTADGLFTARFEMMAAAFAPRTPISLELVEIDGVATSRIVASGITDEHGAWEVDLDFVPPDTQRHTWGCRALGFDRFHRRIATATERFGYR